MSIKIVPIHLIGQFVLVEYVHPNSIPGLGICGHVFSLTKDDTFISVDVCTKKATRKS